MLINSGIILGLVGVATAATYSPPCEPVTLCIDGINDCGIPWGGCYDTCSPDLKPTQPPCSTTSNPYPHPTGTVTSDSTITTFSTITTAPTGSCGVTICEDLIDDCGQMYGGCYDTCSGRPSFTKPVCDITTNTDYCKPATVCEDNIDECGQTYGGCYNTCNGSPTWSKPSCATTTNTANTTATGTITTGPSSSKTTGTVTTTATGTDSTEPTTICVDMVDECGQKYGGCYDVSKGPPKWTKPYCTKTHATTTATGYCKPGWKCEEIVDPCQQTYGGCFDTCGPHPTWSQPDCTVTVTAEPTDYCS